MQIPNTLKKLGIEQAVNYVIKDPEKHTLSLLDRADTFAHGGFQGQREAIRAAVTDPDTPTILW